jgi:multiple sugar transport system permease protein
MVTQIPSFLMLREFQLLNSFAALILPGLASGYSIFLLKGFFDSQPRELYEAAQIDGAGEWTIFWQITMSLAKPILSVIALGAFVGAYGNFMFALLLCQDDRMWTLMVWLYQLQQISGRSVVYASIVIASIPTFVVFVLCQRVILRGIIVPSEK